ncbi:hypothetical protein HMPREF9141_2617 [Prevotella multiformis DSM 16608]|uniref:Uncharacterized protein n=1 Tax=Prevotella multiformis DSM 16608 TaxID=888743 RepID=F0FAK0_9BACT|nr:hypothetical protein HMPREF9141_2617 [Prevotella multiformis DSM 16608]
MSIAVSAGREYLCTGIYISSITDEELSPVRAASQRALLLRVGMPE